MFIRKFLKPNQVAEVNAKGRFIKVMNCEGVFRIRVLSKGHAIVDTDAAAGFDIQTNESFDFIEITSDIEQKLQIWVSEHKLSYDALSTKPSKASSFIVSHYGGEQKITAYDPSQAKAKIVCDDSVCWVGGEGVSSANGIPLMMGEVYTHDSAAPLSAFIPIPSTYFLQVNGSRSELLVGSGDSDRPYWESKSWSSVRDGIYAANARGSYFIDLISGFSKRLNTSFKKAVVNDEVLGGVYYGLDASSAGSIRLRSFNVETLNYGDYDVNLSADNNFRGDHLVIRDGVFYVFGSDNSGSGVARVYTYAMSSGAVTSYYTPELNASYVLDVKRDEVMGVDYVLGGEDLFISVDNFASFQAVIRGIGIVKQLQIFSDHIAINNKGGWKLYNKKDYSRVALPDSAQSIHCEGKIITLLTKSGIYQSVNNGAVFENKDVNFVADTAHLSQVLRVGEVFYFYNYSRIYTFEAGVSKDTEKARFRVLKESF